MIDHNVIYLDLKQEELDEAIAMYKRFKNPETNADRIRAMTDEELAEVFMNLERYGAIHNGGRSRRWWLDWMKQEATE